MSEKIYTGRVNTHLSVADEVHLLGSVKKQSTMDVVVCNTSTLADAQISVYVTYNTDPNTLELKDAITFMRKIEPTGEYEKYDIKVSPNERIYVVSTMDGVSFRLALSRVDSNRSF